MALFASLNYFLKWVFLQFGLQYDFTDSQAFPLGIFSVKVAAFRVFEDGY
jgi:hypothetical protein